MRHFTLVLAAFAALSFSGLARAETPADTLVIADTIDDIVSLDPAESFEFSGQDALQNVYDRLIQITPKTGFQLEPGLAESWSVAADGKTYTFKMKEGLKFHSGNPITAEDAVWSLQRVVKLNKTPAFILTQFGFTPENVEQMIKTTGRWNSPSPPTRPTRSRSSITSSLRSSPPWSTKTRPWRTR
jgi:peptide/nickel transport system substrate-binding protein